MIKTYIAMSADTRDNPPINKNTIPLSIGLVCLHIPENAATPATSLLSLPTHVGKQNT